MSATRIDHLWRKALDAFKDVERHCRLTVEHAEEFRRASYRFAAAILQMQKDDNEALMQLIKSESKTYSQWMDDHFGLIETMGDTRERICAAIEAGVTEREYMDRDSVVIARKRIKASDIVARDDGVIPEPSTEPMTPEERVKELLRINESLRSKYQAARKRAQIVEQELSLTNKRLRQLERTIKRLKRDLEPLEIGQTTKATT